ncbi:MAG: glycosyltransferase family 92 protein [Lachnospiraceae bacterium]|nr:glycosyltransferase family 92 protein [Lachnospiraceae bacterium]
MEAEKAMPFKYELAMVSISKNEGPYIAEWIEYHRLVGFQKFYFYDNESDDNTSKVLSPYIDSGIVEYTLMRGKARQLDAYNDAINKHKHECRWMAFLDMDEYLVPTEPFKPINKIVSELVDSENRGAAGIGVNWAVFGSSGHQHKPEGLITENFVRRGENTHWVNYHIKTVCNPRLVAYYISPHYPLYKIGAYSINDSDGKRLWGWFCHNVAWKNLRINHYFTKSKEQYLQKRNRGLGDRLGKYELEKFDRYDLNDIEDMSMDVYKNNLRTTFLDS